MTRPTLHSLGVQVHYGRGGSMNDVDFFGWWASMEWEGGAIGAPEAMRGTINTKYAEESLTKAINRVMDCSKSLGITPYEVFATFRLTYVDDGENGDYPPPANWMETLQEEAKTRGWEGPLSKVRFVTRGEKP